MIKEQILQMVDDLKVRRVTMIEYLLLKVKERDWHGVADAAMDLRDIESELIGIEGVEELLKRKEPSTPHSFEKQEHDRALSADTNPLMLATLSHVVQAGMMYKSIFSPCAEDTTKNNTKKE